jgi:ABC-type polysaccharide/polyol phosphate transport system ATPase subunit
VAPVIELGVGFQPELPAKDNVLLNAEIMGVNGKQALARLDEVVEFAGLEDYTDLKLKNYSSGMRVRLAFAIALLTDADLYLFDEVLAVGDAAFQDKCYSTFMDLKRDPTKTVVLVTHAMANLHRYCDRAMLLEEGRVDLIGSPHEVARRYNEVLLSDEGRIATDANPASVEEAT